jgi:plasmid maintenance system antidote protein VapI
MSTAELRRAVNLLGGVAAETARRLSIHRVTLSRYLTGKRAVPAALALVLRQEMGEAGNGYQNDDLDDLEWDG